MANEIQASYMPGKTLYCMVFDKIGRVWNTNTGAFESYLTANVANYAVTMTQLGTNSSFYEGTFPATITAGVYANVAKQQIGGAVAETDPTIAIEDPFNWNGTAEVALVDLATSGLMATLLPIRIGRGTQFKPFTFKLVSSLDNTTPFTSGICSGQVARDGGAFGPLQSGAFTEMGLGHYALQALTSGDLLANIVNLVFTAQGVSGGTAAQRDFVIPLQRTSGF